MRVRRTWPIAAAALLAVAPLVPRITNPPLERSRALEADAGVPPPVTAMLHRACYDCHSNQTRWPWYSHLLPVYLMLHHDVVAGREAVNFSEWSSGRGRNPETSLSTFIAACELLQKGAMPKRRYLLMHPAARLSSQEISHFCEWTDARRRQMETQ